MKTGTMHATRTTVWRETIRKTASSVILEWFLDLKAYCEEYEKESVPAEDIYLEKTGKLLIGADEIRRYLKEHPADSMESKC